MILLFINNYLKWLFIVNYLKLIKKWFLKHNNRLIITGIRQSWIHKYDLINQSVSNCRYSTNSRFLNLTESANQLRTHHQHSRAFTITLHAVVPSCTNRQRVKRSTENHNQQSKTALCQSKGLSIYSGFRLFRNMSDCNRG